MGPPGRERCVTAGPRGLLAPALTQGRVTGSGSETVRNAADRWAGLTSLNAKGRRRRAASAGVERSVRSAAVGALAPRAGRHTSSPPPAPRLGSAPWSRVNDRVHELSGDIC